MAEVILRTVFQNPFHQETYRFSVLDWIEYVREFAPEEDQPEEHAQAMQIFQNAMDFRNVKLRECMVPRPEIKALEAQDTVQDLRETLVASGFSKILIYKDSIDNVIGYAHAFDLFRYPDSINSVLKPVIFFPETMLASDALSHLFVNTRALLWSWMNSVVPPARYHGRHNREILGEIDDEFDWKT
jgi:Mg2+/Co2+ transporter CorB